MTSPFRSLRFKLTVLFVATFGVLQSALWVTVDLMRTNYMRSGFNQDLIGHAREVMQAVDAAIADGPPSGEWKRVQEAVHTFSSAEFSVAVRSPKGETLAASETLAGLTLPFDVPSASVSRGSAPGIDTVTGPLADTVAGVGERLRIVTLRGQPDDSGSFYVQVAASLAPADHLIGEMRELLFVFIFVSLVVAGVTSWYISGRSLASIGAIADEARKLTADRLGKHIPVPTSRDEVAEMVTVINEMLDRLKREFENQERFIADVSHQLKTPLTVLLGESQALLRRGEEQRDYERFLDIVHEEARRMSRTVESFLILSRIRRGIRPSLVADVAIEDVVLSSVKRCRTAAQARNVRIVPRLDTDNRDYREPLVAGGFDLLCDMLENLLQNAIRYSPPGETVELTMRCDTQHAVISVRDHGPGIPGGEIDQIFDLFCQLDSASKESGAAGVGLTIAKGVAEIHHGSIAVRNHPEGGAEFTVKLPLNERKD